MKKFKSVATSLLCFLMSGTMLFSVGCNDDKGNSELPDNSESTLPSEENPVVTTATKGDKQYFFNSLTGAVGSLGTNPEQLIKLGVDFDIMIVDNYSEYDENMEVIATHKDVTNVDADISMYVQVAGENLSFDGWLNAAMNYDYDGEKSQEYGYAAGYIRGDDIYAGATDALKNLPTAEDKAAIMYEKDSLTKILEEMMAGTGGGELFPDDGTGEMLPDDGTGEEVVGPTVEEVITQFQPLITKAVTNVFNGLGATVETKGSVKTLVLDFKKEAEGIVAVMELLVNSITDGMTFEQLLNNKALEGLFNKYLGEISATEIRDVIAAFVLTSDVDKDSEEAQAFLPMPEEGESGYAYLVKFICSMPAESPENPDMTMGENVYTEEIKAELTSMLTDVKDALAKVNAVKFSLITVDNAFSGIAIDIDIVDTIDMYFSFTMEMDVEYTFTDVTKLTVEPLVPEEEII